MFFRIPFLRYLLFLVSGVLIFEYLPSPFVTSVDFALVAFGIFLASLSGLILAKKARWAVLKHFRPAIFILFTILGCLSARIHQEEFENQKRQLSGEYEEYVIMVKSLPEKRDRSYRLECNVVRVRRQGVWEQKRANALITVPIGVRQVPEAGTIVLVRGKLVAPGPPLNPGEFDYQTFLRRKGVAWTAFLREEQFVVIDKMDEPWNPVQWSWQVSTWVSELLRRKIVNDNAYGLIRAMILGRRDDLQSELVDDFVSSGTVHVLSVSGLHVGIFFAIVGWLFGWLRRFRGGRLIYFLVLSVLLLFYGLITGMPACVQRAIIMCLTWAFAEVLLKQNEPVNTLAYSAFLIILLDPYAFMEVGFQLSYLAVLGIVLFYKPIERWFHFKNRAANYIWQVSAVSLAAQLTTFPVSIYYFHQFPVYFLLVNPVVIALTTLLLPVTMLLIVMTLIPYPLLVDTAAQVVEGIADLVNYSVSLPKLLPGYLLENLYIDGIELALILVILFLIWLAIYSHRIVLIGYITVATILFAGYSMYSTYRTYHRNELVVFSVPRHYVVGLKQGNHVYLIADESFNKDERAFLYRIKGYLLSRRVSTEDTVSLSTATGLSIDGQAVIVPHTRYIDVVFHGTHLCVGDFTQATGNFDAYLITSPGLPKPFEIPVNNTAVFLLSRKMSYRAREQWKEAIQKSGSTYYELADQGAWMADPGE